MMTNYKASRYRIVAVSLDQTAESSWRISSPKTLR